MQRLQTFPSNFEKSNIHQKADAWLWHRELPVGLLTWSVSKATDTSLSEEIKVERSYSCLANECWRLRVDGQLDCFSCISKQRLTFLEFAFGPCGTV